MRKTQERARRTGGWSRVAATLAAVTGAVLGVGCREGARGGEARRERPPPEVVVQRVRREDAVVSRSYLVTLEPREQASVVSRTSGYVLAYFVDRGDKVRRGQRLAVVESRELSDQERQAAAQLQAARAAHQNALDQAERARRLVAQAFLSQAEADAAETQVRVTEAQVRAAEAALGLTRTRKGYAAIEAPFDGYVVKRHVDVGALVGPQGPALFTVGSLTRLKAVAAVAQPDVPFLKVGQPVLLTLDGVEGGPWEGRIARMSPALDAATRTLEVELEFSGLDERVKPGMFGRVTLEMQRVTGAILVPPRAVARKGREGVAFVVRDGRAHEVRLRLGRTFPDGRVEVVGGLEEGDLLVTLGREMVRDGAVVRAVEAGAPDHER